MVYAHVLRNMSDAPQSPLDALYGVRQQFFLSSIISYNKLLLRLMEVKFAGVAAVTKKMGLRNE
jgi:hypothetical protein